MAARSPELVACNPEELDVVLMIVGVDLDTDPRVSVGSHHPDAWDDIRSALATRLYEVDA